MPFSVQDFVADLAKDGLLTAEETASISAIVAKDPKVAKRLEEMTLRQSDYSRRMAEVQNKEKSLTETEKALTQWKSEAEAKLKQALTDRDTLRTTQSQYEAQVRKVADAYGFDADEVLKPNGQPMIPPPQTAPSIDTSNFISKEEWQKQSASVQTLLPQLTGAMIDLAAEHQTLFGQPLANSRQLLEKALADRRPLEDVWADEYKVADRRQQLAADQQKQWEEKIRAEERQKLLSEQSLPMQQRADTARAAVFSMGPDSAKQTANAPKNENRGVEDAVRAYAEGKYRPPV